MPTSTARPSSRLRVPLSAVAAAIALLTLAAACSDAPDAGSFDVSPVGMFPAVTEAAAAYPLELVVTDQTGAARAGIRLDFAVQLGGGSVTPASAVSDAEGHVSLTWTLGLAPVRNRLDATVEGRDEFLFDIYATLATPYEPQPFGDVNAFLTDLGIAGSTEDLAFSPDGERLLMGVPGGLIELDPQGNATQLALTGDALVNPLGIAFDRAGNLWVADSGADALQRVSPTGEVTTVLTSDGTRPLVGPNYVAIGPDDKVYLSDPCLGALLRFDPQSNRVDAVLDFDLPVEGGPNGFAFDASGKRLFLATENTGLLCGHSFVGITDPIAGLFAIDVDDSSFTGRQTIAADFALFGDGVAFDVEGNLYVIFDTQKNFMLEESALWVLQAGNDRLVKVAAVHGRVLANIAFGSPQFGGGTAYLALLAVPGFTPATARGAELLDLGIAGLPLLP